MNSEKADLILYNGKIAAFDKKNTICEALASRLGIIQIGKLDEIWKLLGSDTVVIDLGGRFVTPGLVDCHIHKVNLHHR